MSTTQEILNQYPEDAQKRWKANPLIESILVRITNNIKANAGIAAGTTGSGVAPAASVSSANTNVSSANTNVASAEPDSDSESEEPFDLFG